MDQKLASAIVVIHSHVISRYHLETRLLHFINTCFELEQRLERKTTNASVLLLSSREWRTDESKREPMADWKARGEVPDSEDDSESEHSQTEQTVFFPLGHSTEVRDGIESQILYSPNHLKSRVHPTPQTEPYRKEAARPLESTSAARNVPTTVSRQTQPENGNDSDSDSDISILSSAIFASSPLIWPSDSQPTSNRSGEVDPEPGDDQPTPFSPFVERTEGGPQDTPLSGRNSTINTDYLLESPYVRPLRPRKPIQQHPYLLEGAQYAKALLSRGIKPLKHIDQESPKKKRQEEADSQDNEFEDDSQEGGHASLLVSHDSQESRGSLEPIARTTDNELRSLSSTPRTSPRNNDEPSSQVSLDGTENSSVLDEDFPTLDDLIQHHGSEASSHPAKKRRTTPPKSSTSQKRLKAARLGTIRTSVVRPTTDIYDLSPSPPATGRIPSSAHHTHLRRLDSERDESSPKFKDVGTRGHGTSPRPNPNYDEATPYYRSFSNKGLMIDLTSIEQDELGERHDVQDTPTLSEPPESDSEASDGVSAAFQRIGKRLRGVLPPSYLRLNLQKSGASPRVTSQDVASKSRQLIHSPGRHQKKGVAQPRPSSPSRISSRNNFLLDESDEEEDDMAIRNRPTGTEDLRQTRLVLEPIDIEDDGVEEHTPLAKDDSEIDYMLPPREYASSRIERQFGKRKSLSYSSEIRPHAKKRQRTITSHFGALDTVEAPKPSKPRRRNHSTKPAVPKPARKHKPYQSHRQATPPRLSILDVIEPGAPRFLKIAARAARYSVGLGRSSPSTKIFQMASRWDHRDVNETLHHWKSGRMKPRLSKDAKPRVRKTSQRRTGSNRAPDTPVKGQHRARKEASHRLIKRISDSGRISYTSQDEQGHMTRTPVETMHSGAHERPSYQPARPALLETGGKDVNTRHDFHTRKRILDNLYRNQRRSNAVLEPAASALRTTEDDEPLSASSILENNGSLGEFPPSSVQQPSGSRFRKRYSPQHLETGAPQFTHANYPIPEAIAPSSETFEPSNTEARDGKLKGLGPFGTVYSHNFDIFPLSVEVYFHETTVIGEGRLRKATEIPMDPLPGPQRPRAFLELNGRTLRWGVWDEAVSSEFGILMDSILDQVGMSPSAQPDSAPRLSETLRLADFILSYLQDSLAFSDDVNRHTFYNQVLETFQSFLIRVEPTSIAVLEKSQQKTVLGIISRLFLCLSTAIAVSKSSIEFGNMTLQLEQALRCCSVKFSRCLRNYGLGEILSFYDDCHRRSARERGIRSSHIVLQAWVVLSTILEWVKIPRFTFWDAVFPAGNHLENEPKTTSVQNLEKEWMDMFTLLPLREFDPSGAIRPRRQRIGPEEGWGLPQQLLKRVFHLYKENNRQPASFNDYCRALVSRCHYLVLEWGWQKCNGIIGVIFDFFASLDLSHLRNEETYKSPRFLEELSTGPSLAVEGEDRCFHIFLKLVAVVISRLRDQDDTKQIRNLIARILPNHNRQYLKDQEIHQRDLASLRNHHDLLCTIFWVSPASLRPGAQMIEKLVIPADSHKEACTVNLRAWTQLARFIVADGADDDTFATFHRWQTNIFNAILDQFETAESEIHQQYSALPADDSQTISQAHIDLTISMNKAAAKDTLYLCLKSSLEVMKHAKSLPAARFALNTNQLDAVLRHFSLAPPTLDWGILQAALDVVDAYMLQTETISSGEASAIRVESCSADVGSDRVGILYRELSKSFFSMARCILGAAEDNMGATTTLSNKLNCIEHVMRLSGRLVYCFASQGLINVGQVFAKDGLFRNVPHMLPLSYRKYLPLFVIALLQEGPTPPGESVSDFSLLELWVLSIVKPRPFLSYENELGKELRRRGEMFVPEATHGLVALNLQPSYRSNRELFQAAVSWMHRTYRNTDNGSKNLTRANFARILDNATEQIKRDLKVMSLDGVEQTPYVDFVRGIVSVIRSQGFAIGSVDKYFLQISNEYSPSLQDPNLHIAGITSYGRRLADGEPEIQVSRPLFHYLYNNFKVSLSNNKLGNESHTLRMAMKDQYVMGLVLGGMLPSIIRAAFKMDVVFPLLEVYYDAIADIFTGPAVPIILEESVLPHALFLFQTITTLLRGLMELSDDVEPSVDQVHIIKLVIGLVCILWPPIRVHMFSSHPHPSLEALGRTLQDIYSFSTAAEKHTAEVIALENTLGFVDLCEGLRPTTTTTAPPPLPAALGIADLADFVLDDVRENWIVTPGRISVRAPRSQEHPGIQRPERDSDDVVDQLQAQLREWNMLWEWSHTATAASRRRRIGFGNPGLVVV